MNSTPESKAQAPRRTWNRPELRKLGNLADLTRTTVAGEFRADSVNNTYYMS